MSVLTLQELFASAKPKLVPETITWSGNTCVVYFQRLSMEDSADATLPFLNTAGSGIEKGQIKNFQAALLSRIIRDESGASAVTPEQVLGWDSAFYQAIQAASEKHNPTSAAALEEIAKNSAATPSTAVS